MTDTVARIAKVIDGYEQCGKEYDARYTEAGEIYFSAPASEIAAEIQRLTAERDALRTQLDAIATVSALAGGYTNDGRYIEVDALPGEIEKILDGKVPV